ncbi:hypothetical protein ACWC0C_18635 [Streptomyces sp. NPDC001709]
MASIRTARVLAAVAAVPLAAALFGGVAAADNGAIADNGSSANTTQQGAVGFGASNQSNTAQVSGSAFTPIQPGDGNVAINFIPLW